ncbi:MAG: hypothetical protein ACFB9M_13950 [Myxococcota bacterium]
MTFLKPRYWATCAFVWALVSASGSATAARRYGAVLPDEARQVGTDRFVSQQDYQRTLRWFRRVYGQSDGVFFRPLHGSPEVRGVFIQNIRPGRGWDGINLYEARSRVQFVVLPATRKP